MTNNQIRVQYSGFIIFASQILSIATGLAFTLLLTRNMTSDDYGTWTLIPSLITWFVFFSGLFPFWATRFAARDSQGTIKTAVSTNLVIGLIATIVYLPLLPFLIKALDIPEAYYTIYALAGLQILSSYLITILEGCLRSVRPQTIGYGLLIQEIVKVGVAFSLFFVFNELFIGAMLGLILGGFVQIGFYAWLVRGYFKQRIHWGYLKEWLKGSAAFLYSALGGQLFSAIFIILYFFSSSGMGIYQAALTFTAVVAYSSSLAFALYPKMLSRNYHSSQVSLSFSIMMMLAIPMAAIAMVMSTSFLAILNAIYIEAWPVLILLIIDTLITLISMFYSNCLMGAETFDAEGKIPLRQLVGSKIFKVFTISYIQAGIALPAAYFGLMRIPEDNPVLAASFIVIILIIVHLTGFAGLLWFMRKSEKIIIGYKNIAKYIVTTIVMAVVLFMLPYPSTLILTLAKTGLGMAIYITLLLAIDKQARKLAKTIIDEIKLILHLRPAKPENGV